jgi:hypothetical protein
VVRITSRTKTSTTTRIAASSILRRPVRVIEVLPNGVCGGAVQFDGWFDVDQNLTTAFDVGYAMTQDRHRCLLLRTDIAVVRVVVPHVHLDVVSDCCSCANEIVPFDSIADGDEVIFQSTEAIGHLLKTFAHRRLALDCRCLALASPLLAGVENSSDASLLALVGSRHVRPSRVDDQHECLMVPVAGGLLAVREQIIEKRVERRLVRRSTSPRRKHPRVQLLGSID